MKKDTNRKAVLPQWSVRAKAIMAAQGVTQDDLKETFGVGTRGSVGHYLSGRREPSIEQIMRLSKRLGVTTSELVGEMPLADSRYTKELSQLLQAVGEENLPVLVAMIRAAAAEFGKETDAGNQ